MSTGPNLGLMLIVAGTFTVYREFVRPGKVWPGAIGSIALATGAYSLWQRSPSKEGLALLAVSLAFFLAEAVFRARLLYGLAGAVTMALAFIVLLPRPGRISPLLAISLSLLLAAVTIFLVDTAKKARRNKRGDLGLGLTRLN